MLTEDGNILIPSLQSQWPGLLIWRDAFVDGVKASPANTATIKLPSKLSQYLFRSLISLRLSETFTQLGGWRWSPAAAAAAAAVAATSRVWLQFYLELLSTPAWTLTLGCPAGHFVHCLVMVCFYILPCAFVLCTMCICLFPCPLFHAPHLITIITWFVTLLFPPYPLSSVFSMNCPEPFSRVFISVHCQFVLYSYWPVCFRS